MGKEGNVMDCAKENYKSIVHGRSWEGAKIQEQKYKEREQEGENIRKIGDTLGTAVTVTMQVVLGNDWKQTWKGSARTFLIVRDLVKTLQNLNLESYKILKNYVLAHLSLKKRMAEAVNARQE